MAAVDLKTRFGLPKEYYKKHFIVGAVITGLLGVFAIVFNIGLLLAMQKELASQDNKEVLMAVLIIITLILELAFLALIAVLYPYSRYVFDIFLKWLVGDGILIASIWSIWIWRFTKFWLVPPFLLYFTIFLGPLGIILLRIQKSDKKDEGEHKPLTK